MITFIWIFAALIVVGAGWLVAYGANQRKRAGMSGKAEVTAQQTGAGAPTVGRPTGTN